MGIFSRILTVVFLFVSYQLNAQLCQGSLGDPIVNITFGAGANPGPSLSAATTNYQFVVEDCPNDGFYTVRNNTQNCFSSSWHSVSNDHTGDLNGYFMLVNASLQPSAFYVDTVKGLCSNTTFEFAAWVVNVLKSSACGANGNQPNLTFTIEKTDGSVIQTYNTGNIAQSSSPVWKQYGFFFATPPGISDIVLRIFNNAQGGCGNDLALDDITFRPCGPQISSAINGYAGDTVSFCKDAAARSFAFSTMISAGFNTPAFQWQQSTDGITWTDIPGAITNSYNVNFSANALPGKYLYRLSGAEQGNLNSARCRVASKPLVIEVNPIPVTTVTANTPICEKQALTVTATGGAQYQWTTAGGIISTGNPFTISSVQLADAGKIKVLVTSDKGCTKLDSVNVSVLTNPVATVGFTSASICSDKSIRLSAGGGNTYKWFPAAGLNNDAVADPQAAPTASIAYTVVVTSNNGCTDTAHVQVNVLEKPSANAGADKTIIAGNQVQLSATVSGQDVSFLWSPANYLSSNSVLQPMANPPTAIDYILTATSNAGCGVDIDTVHVFVFNDLYIPNAFSPDGNGVNDTWNIPALNAFPNFELFIYNRRGQLIYQSKNILHPWDGTYKGEPQPAGAYVYMIDVKEKNRPLYKGTLLLIR